MHTFAYLSLGAFAIGSVLASEDIAHVTSLNLESATLPSITPTALPTKSDCELDDDELTTSPPVTDLPESWTTSTIYSTSLITITSCPPAVPHCPAEQAETTISTVSVAISTTVCPVTDADATPTGHSGSGSGPGSSPGSGPGHEGSNPHPVGGEGHTTLSPIGTNSIQPTRGPQPTGIPTGAASRLAGGMGLFVAVVGMIAMI